MMSKGEDTMTKEENYLTLLPQAEALLSGEKDLIANMANIAALLHHTFRFWWTGFYRVEGDELVLGPFQGPIACTRIKKGRGVCGTTWLREQTIIVDDVHKFEGHIACSAESNSEIVVPLKKDGQIVAVLDIDSRDFSNFDSIDQLYLEKIMELM